MKEDLGLTVLAIGLVIAGRGERRLGLATAAAGLAGSLLAILVALPAFNPGGSFAYWSFLETPGGGGGRAAQLLYRSTIGLVTPEAKATTLLLVLAPTLFLALRSPCCGSRCRRCCGASPPTTRCTGAPATTTRWC